MLCVICGEKCKVIETRLREEISIRHRTYECKECLTRFKTTEKILFSSVPYELRNKYLEDGRR